ncbi:MAG: hypothetical protein OEY25_00445 [Candidatus Aminicenantes bacterium]|nr:hypothetical protein [Candidatus Aminicenantes bacterium]MDH5704539.1 hypothetical protein [Candidatus Aminicenantes bacterium]
MSLTLNQFLFLVITIAVVVFVTFLVSLILQLRRTAKEGGDTLIEVRELVRNLRETDKKLKEKMDDISLAIEATKKTALGLSEITWFLTSKVIRPSSKYWPLLFPILRFGWRQIKKKRKERKNGR